MQNKRKHSQIKETAQLGIEHFGDRVLLSNNVVDGVFVSIEDVANLADILKRIKKGDAFIAEGGMWIQTKSDGLVIHDPEAPAEQIAFDDSVYNIINGTASASVEEGEDNA